MSETQEASQQSLKFISFDEFKDGKITDPLPYKDGELITRENFMSWVIKGFAVSRGDTPVQYGYIRWTSHQSGQDFTKILDNFKEAGGEQCLSEQEIELFRQAYNKVKRHNLNEPSDEDDIDEAFSPSQLNMLSVYSEDFTAPVESKQYKDTILKDFPTLEIFDNLSKEEFMKWANDRFQATLEKRKEEEKLYSNDWK